MIKDLDGLLLSVCVVILVIGADVLGESTCSQIGVSFL